MYEDLDATALAELVATRQVTPAELLEDAIRKTDAAAATLGAVPIRFDDVARAQAGQDLAGPFAGVPFLLKDIGQEYAGQPHTAGAAPYRNRRPAAHSAYTRRCLDAGLVIFGRTATPELGLKAVTESAVGAHAQPVGQHAHRGRQLRRVCRRGGRRAGGDGGRQ